MRTVLTKLVGQLCHLSTRALEWLQQRDQLSFVFCTWSCYAVNLTSETDASASGTSVSRRSPTHERSPQALHPKLQQGGWHRGAAAPCSRSGKPLPSSRQRMLLRLRCCRQSDSSAWKSPLQVRTQDRLPSLPSHASNALRSTDLLQGVAQYPS